MTTPTPNTVKPNQWTKGFYSGVLSTIAILDHAGENKLIHEVVNACGKQGLFNVAEPYDMEILKRNGIKP